MVTSSSGSAAEGAKDIWKRNAALAFGLLLCGRIHTQLIRLIEDALHWTENLEEGSVTGITHGLSSPVSGLTQRKLQNARGPRTGSRSRLRRPARQLVTQAMRVWSVSDIHSDYKENLAWIENLSLDEYQDDTLIVAGDVSDSPDVIRQSLKLFCERWREVFYVFGNHELWVRGKERDDIDSLGQAADSLGPVSFVNTGCVFRQDRTDSKHML
ncbi:hypothetical protein MMC29_003609 [Sticta canariensis]|nr:hypothetical protein [Sticta canariensis]